MSCSWPGGTVKVVNINRNVFISVGQKEDQQSFYLGIIIGFLLSTALVIAFCILGFPSTGVALKESTLATEVTKDAMHASLNGKIGQLKPEDEALLAKVRSLLEGISMGKEISGEDSMEAEKEVKNCDKALKRNKDKNSQASLVSVEQSENLGDILGKTEEEEPLPENEKMETGEEFIGEQ